MEKIRIHSFQAWLLASRPKTLMGAAVPMMIALSMAYVDSVGHVDMSFSHWVLPALLCVAFAMLMQIDANFINDYFDFVRGNDDETRLGPRRACAEGWVTPRAMKIAIGIVTMLACAVGLPLIYFGGWLMVLVGLACVVFCFLYTTTLSYWGLGDVLVLVFFGIVPVCVTYYILMRTLACEVFVASLACGLVIDTLLIINNYRDIDNDRRAGKNTLIVRVGAQGGRWLYLAAGFLAVLLAAVFIDVRLVLFCLPYLCLHVLTWREMCRINRGKALNLILAKTSRNMFVFGLAFSLGILLIGL